MRGDCRERKLTCALLGSHATRCSPLAASLAPWLFDALAPRRRRRRRCGTVADEARQFPVFFYFIFLFLSSLCGHSFHLSSFISFCVPLVHFNQARRTEGRLAALAQDTRTRPSGLDLEPPRLEAEGWRRLGLGRSSPSFFTGHGGTLHRWEDAPLSLDSSFPFLSRSLILYFSTLSVRRGYLTCTISL